MIYNCDSTWTIMIPSLPASVMDRPWYVPFHQIWWTGHGLWLWLFLDHYDTFPSSWCDGQAMICDCSSSWIIMIRSLLTGVMDRQWSMIVALPRSLWYLPVQLVWWTGHGLWLWLFLDHYDTSSSSWHDGQAMIPSLPAGVKDRPWSMIVALPGSLYIPFKLVWWTGHDTFPSNWCDGQAMMPSLPDSVMDRPWSMIVALPGSLWYLSVKLVWLTGHEVWMWLFLNHYNFPSSWRDGQATIHSIPAGVMDSPWSMIVALSGILWYLPFQLVWWTDHDLWLWLFRIIMVPSLPAGVMDRPRSMIVALLGSLW